MSLIINHNLMAMNASRNLGKNYGELKTSIRRLSSGLRIGNAADDAAGLSVRELMRADVSVLNQGVRNTNDAISMIQTADGALQIIDEKLIRMKELAEQAATGTYSSDQRIIINSEFQAMALEIQRISEATDFNGIKLLDGSLSGNHDGSGLNSTGAAKVHFGTGNDSAEDYYYIKVENAGLEGLNLATTMPEKIKKLSDVITPGKWVSGLTSGVIPISYIPKGATNVTIKIDANGAHVPTNLSIDDDIALFTRSGKHLAGYPVGNNPANNNPGSNDWVWAKNGLNLNNINSNFITEDNGFYENAVYDSSEINTGNGFSSSSGTKTSSFNGMNISYGGDGNWYDSVHNNNFVDPTFPEEYLHIDKVTEDLLLFSVGGDFFSMSAEWEYIPKIDYSRVDKMRVVDIRSQEGAQKALDAIDNAIIYKDNIRANLGAMQNRLEATAENISIQAENLQAAESRISDTDVAKEMTKLVKNQILTQASASMLAQANSIPEMALKVING